MRLMLAVCLHFFWQSLSSNLLDLLDQYLNSA